MCQVQSPAEMVPQVEGAGETDLDEGQNCIVSEHMMTALT